MTKISISELPSLGQRLRQRYGRFAGLVILGRGVLQQWNGLAEQISLFLCGTVALLILTASSVCIAEQTKTVYNPFTSKLDYITALTTTSIQAGSGVTVSTTSSGVLITGSGGSGSPAGSSGDVQYNNAGSFGGASFFNVSASSVNISSDFVFNSNSIGPVLTDSASCTWRQTVTTAGNLVTTLIGCPVVASNFRPCKRGMPVGILLSITCENL